MATPTPNMPTPTSTAAASSQPSTVPQIPLDLITESPTNPRKTRNAQADKELADSVKTHGVVQPVLVRRRGVKYELVVGSRRFRAAKAAGLKQIPATIRELTDEQVLELQIIENLQRQDVAPLEEGQGYTQLIGWLAQHNLGRKRQDLVLDVAQKVGKSARYVYARMKLAELPEAAQKLLESGFLTTSHADELVRLQTADQKLAVEFLTKEREQYSSRVSERKVAPSIRDLKAWIGETLSLDLSKAPFKLDDAKLVPDAGACTACPKMVGNNPIAFEGSGLPANRCTDAPCYQKKKLALVKISVDAIAAKAGVEPVLISTKYREDRGHGESVKGIIFADGYSTSGHDKNNKQGPIKPKSCPRAALAVYIDGDKIGQTVWICRTSEMGSRECPEHRYKYDHNQGGNDGAARKAAILQNKYRVALFGQLSAKLLKAPAAIKRDDLVMAAGSAFNAMAWPAPGRVAFALGWTKKPTERLDDSDVVEKLAKASVPEILAHIVLFTAGREMSSPWGQPTDMVEIAERHRIDAGQVLKDLREASKKRKAKAKLPPKKAVQTSAKPKAKAVKKGGRR